MRENLWVCLKKGTISEIETTNAPVGTKLNAPNDSQSGLSQRLEQDLVLTSQISTAFGAKQVIDLTVFIFFLLNYLYNNINSFIVMFFL